MLKLIQSNGSWWLDWSQSSERDEVQSLFGGVVLPTGYRVHPDNHPEAIRKAIQALNTEEVTLKEVPK